MAGGFFFEGWSSPFFTYPNRLIRFTHLRDVSRYARRVTFGMCVFLSRPGKITLLHVMFGIFFVCFESVGYMKCIGFLLESESFEGY